MSDKAIENKEACSVAPLTLAPLIENHRRVVTTENEVEFDGHHLIEKKQKTLINGNYRTLVHIRSIDEKSYKLTEIYFINGFDRQVVWEPSGMTEDEVKKFEEDWKNLWKPERTKMEIEKLNQ